MGQRGNLRALAGRMSFSAFLKDERFGRFIKHRWIVDLQQTLKNVRFTKIQHTLKDERFTTE